MTWLLRLYPPRWRRRYGREFAELVAAQPRSFGVVVDVMAGAIDAWVKPQLAAANLAAPATKEEALMMARTMRFRCAGYGEPVTKADAWKAMGVMLGGTMIFLAFVWLLRSRSNAGQLGPFGTWLLANAWLFPVILSLRYTSLKGRSASVQWTFMGGVTVILILIGLVKSWL